MSTRKSVVAATAFAFLLSMGAGLVQAADGPSSAQLANAREKVGIANGLVVMGRDQKDPILLAAALKILANLNQSVIDPASTKDGGAPTPYDLGTLAKEAKSYAGDNKALAEEIANVKLPADAASPGVQNYCGWDYAVRHASSAIGSTAAPGSRRRNACPVSRTGALAVK